MANEGLVEFTSAPAVFVGGSAITLSSQSFTPDGVTADDGELLDRVEVAAGGLAIGGNAVVGP